ncbi:hypothetical protein AB0O67_23300 [Streptomyces sp. NPDC086077]|uniref:hypothetical protein n=1 Tax=Streptomyces sp. NPDC086077 TaxID=3154862 RepID=UPI00344AC7BB
MDTSNEAARGLTDIEGFLYWEAHLRTAHRRATDFVSRVTGLSPTQKAEIEWWYVQEQLRVSQSITRHLTDHITAVEEHHARRYTRLRRGAYAATTLFTTLILTLCVAVLLGTAA